MRKQYSLTVLLLCSLLGTIYSKSGVPYKTYFPDCELTITASSTEKDTICLGSSVDLVATASNGTTPYTYSWLPTAGLSNSHIANPVATPTVSTNYTVTVTDHSGCTATASVSIIVNQPPVVVADSLLEQYLTNRPLTAVGGTPPYTYNFSPAISTSGLVTMLTSTVTTIYTITVTGANGCANVYHATYTPLQGITAGACRTPFISEYIQDTIHNNDGIEIYNPSSSAINMNTYYLAGTTNGSLYATPFFIALHGTIAAHSTFLIANTYADTSLTHKAGMLSDSLSFGGKDIVTLLNINVSVSGVQTTALDMVGAISPLPTDSGWAVGAGSTKNHTLTRLTSVTQGTPIWSICKSEWNVYSRGTFSYIGHYSNTCAKDPLLILSIANPVVSCGSPSYFQFDIMASSIPNTVINSAVIEFKYVGVEFTGDYFDIGNVIKADPNFIQYDPYIDGSNNTDSMIDLGFGASRDSTLNGTLLTSTPQPMIHVYMQMQNICQAGRVSFGDTSIQVGYYVVADSVGHLDSTRSYYTTCCPYHCGDTVGPKYLCNEYCCLYDIYFNCIDSCWDTCNLYPVYCYDTTWHYTYDSTYHVVSYSNLAYNNVIYNIDTLYSYSSCPPVISDFNDSMKAGIGNILTISGANFGSTQGTGQVKFYDADSAHYIIQKLNNTDYLDWNNSQIQIKLPSFADSAAPSSLSPLVIGGGNFIVTNSCNDSAVSNLNAHGDPFSIDYNLVQSWNYHNGMKEELLLRGTDTSGGYLIRFDSITFPKGSVRRAIFYKAMRDWTCYTGINWTVGPDTSYTYIPGNFVGVNYVFFTTNIPGTEVAETDRDPTYCSNDSNLLEQGVIYFNSDTNVIRFIYDTTETQTIPAGHADFYGVCLHELGHFIGLEHSVVPTSLMYRTANTGPISPANRITLASDASGSAVDGGNYSVHQSERVHTTCLGYSTPMTGKGTSCVNEYSSIKQITEPNNTFILYPNPSNGTFTIDASISNYTIMVTNMLGQIILSKKVNEEKTVISLANVSNGMYFVQEYYTNGIVSQKIIITK